MSDIDEELTEEQEDLIGRLVNWKFGSALNYQDALKKKSSLECLELLHEMWGNTGWGDGKFSDTLYYLVEYIRMNEEYTREEFYGDDDEESDSDICKSGDIAAKFKLYKCTRYPEEQTDETGEWMGALLILAETPKEAEAIFQEFERGNKPEQIIEIKLEEGVIYDDYMR